MPELVLTSLKFLFLALLYLFVARTVRVIWLDIAGTGGGGRRRQAVAAPPRPRAAARASRGTVPRSVAVVEEGKSPSVLPLRDQAITLGRATECSAVLDDTYVSQLHTKIFPKDGGWFVMDLGSTNGTYLNRMKVSDPMPIAPGDEVRLGKTVVEVRAK